MWFKKKKVATLNFDPRVSLYDASGVFIIEVTWPLDREFNQVNFAHLLYMMYKAYPKAQNFLNDSIEKFAVKHGQEEVATFLWDAIVQFAEADGAVIKDKQEAEVRDKGRIQPIILPSDVSARIYNTDGDDE